MLEINIAKIIDKKIEDIKELKNAKWDIEKQLIKNWILTEKLLKIINEYKEYIDNIKLDSNDSKYLISVMEKNISIKNFLTIKVWNINKNSLKELITLEETTLYLKEKSNINDGEIEKDNIINKKIKIQIAWLKIFYAYIQDLQQDINNIIGSITDVNIYIINKLKVINSEKIENNIIT